jgi:hypothetical protein
LRELLKIIKLLILVFVYNVNCYAQDPAYYKIGETEFANTHIFTLLYEDETDVIYAGTDNGLYAYKQNKFTRIHNAKEQKGNAVFSLMQNSKNEIFCINLSGQIFKVNGDSLELYYQFDKKKSNNYFWCSVVENDALLVANKKIIKKINKDGTVEELYNKPDTWTILQSKQTTEAVFYYIVSIDEKKEVLQYKNNTLKHFDIKSQLDIVDAMTGFFSQNGKSYGLNRAGKLINFEHNLLQQFKRIDKEQTFSVTENLSIGLGVQSGARYFYLEDNVVTTSKMIFEKTFLSSFATSKSNMLLFGTFGEGVIVVPNYKVSKISRDVLFLDIVATPDNEVALCTRSGEVFSFKDNFLTQIDKVPNNTDHIFYFPNFQFEAKKKFIYNDIESLNLGIKDAVAINTNELIYTTAEGINWLKAKKRTTLTLKRCNTIAWSKKDSIIFFTSNDGVRKRHLTNPTVHSLLLNNKPFLANDLNYVNDQLICASTTKGVLIFEKEKLVFQLDERDGLLSNTVKQVAVKNNILYVLSKKGMQVYDLTKNRFLGLGVSEGVVANYIVKFALSDDKLWLLEKHSFSSVNINTITKNIKRETIANLYIDSLKFDNKIIDFKTKNIFNYTENKMAVYFDYRNIATKAETKIAYQLKGYQDEWKTISTSQNKIVFNALPTGKYIFKIRANYRNQKTNTYTYAFTIKPPFWRTWWFYTLISIAIFSFMMYRFKQIKNKTKLLLEKQQLKTSVLDSELKALRSQMNPHFIFNSLNSIQGLILEQKTDASYDYIVLFANLVRNTLNYSSKDFIPIYKELEFLDVYLKLEKLRFGDDFIYTIDYTGDKEIKVPSLIVQPFIENALLHGLLHKKGIKKLSITFEFSSQLKCIIIDNGIGREKAKQIQERQGKIYDSFALGAIKKRLEILSAKSSVEASFTTIDLYENNLPIGTKVIIILPFKNIF